MSEYVYNIPEPGHAPTRHKAIGIAAIAGRKSIAEYGHDATVLDYTRKVSALRVSGTNE